MKAIILSAFMLLVGTATVAFGQKDSLIIASQIRVFPVDTTDASSFSYIYRFVRSGQYIMGQTSTNGLIRSSDNGKTWQSLNLKFSGGITLALGVTDSGTCSQRDSEVFLEDRRMVETHGEPLQRKRDGTSR